MTLNQLAVEYHLQQLAPEFALEFHKIVDGMVSITQSFRTPSRFAEVQDPTLSRVEAFVEISDPFQRPSTAPDSNMASPATTAGIVAVPRGATEVPRVTSTVTKADSIPRIQSVASLPWNFSCHETSFPRRLRRSFVERSYHLLSKYDTKRDELLWTLRFRLAWFGLEELRLRAKNYLFRSTSEQLECYVPTTPSRFGTPNVIQKTSRALRLLPISSVFEDFTITQIHMPGYEGVWLSPDDVTLYLQRLGIPVHNYHNSAYIQWIVPNYVLPDILQNIDDSKVARRELTDSWLSATGQNSMFASRTEDIISQLPLQMDPALPKYPDDTATRMAVVDLDLDLVVDSLTKRAVCAVSAPVYRKEDVDRIIRNSVIAWYRSQR